ncbi:hypothetical protein TNCV_5094711 [Trichonephila clavipes]|nr:hypothetical protein TNCV_5094711 [Trichonephila clavipes]
MKTKKTPWIPPPGRAQRQNKTSVKPIRIGQDVSNQMFSATSIGSPTPSISFKKQTIFLNYKCPSKSRSRVTWSR